MRGLVTGGAGFIGVNLVRHALATSDRLAVAVLDATIGWDRANVAGWRPLEAAHATAAGLSPLPHRRDGLARVLEELGARR
jgi:nucleoside-diphosphate-sugar epimerase